MYKFDPTRQQAKNLSSYIISKYGSRAFGQFKTLCAIPSFLDNLATFKPMISFEKILRERHGIYWNGGAGFVQLSIGGRTERFDDDLLGSVGGAIVSSARSTYGQYERFAVSPVVQTVHGSPVDDIIASIDIGALQAVVIPALVTADPDAYTDLAAAFNDDAALLKDTPDDFTVKYSFVESAHELLVKMRMDENVMSYAFSEKGEQLPLAKVSELPLVIVGKLRRSVKLEQAAQPVLAAINAMHGGKGEISANGDELLFYHYDPFKTVKSKFVAVPTVPHVDEKTATVAGPSAASKPRTEGVISMADLAAAMGATEGSTIQPACDGEDDDAVDEVDADLNGCLVGAVNQLAEAMRKNKARMTESELLKFFYGTADGEAAWEGLDKTVQKTFLAQYKAGKPYAPKEWMAIGVKWCDENGFGLTPKQSAELVAGRTYHYRSQLITNLQGAKAAIKKKA